MAWRRAGRALVRETNEARRKYYKDRVAAAGTKPAELWQVVKTLLHSTSATTVLDFVTAKARADSFLLYFVNKLEKIRSDIKVKLNGSFVEMAIPSGQNSKPFTVLKPVTPLKLLA